MSKTIRLREIAHGRSGDKGNHANVAIIAYTAEGYAWIKDHVTKELVADFFQQFQPTLVERFEADNLLALNFLLHNVLGGGASGSLRIDTQGKTFALAVLEIRIPKPERMISMVRQ